MTSAARPRADAPDEELAAGAAGGDRDAMDLLLRRHQERVYRICRRLCGNDADALDAAQEALITVARRIDRFDGRSAFTTWLYRVATNACLDELRRRQRRPSPGREEDVAATLGSATADHHAGDPGELVARRADIDGALAQLSPEFRAAVVLRDVAGLDYAEIATVLELAPGTVRSRISRGRGQLARLLGNQPAPEQRPTPRPTTTLPPAGPSPSSPSLGRPDRPDSADP
ncbi:MAG: sigma-70 family RNA polymerase sigma factor [Acidimicrobiia bacterium]|nr:sigma-70 family RNA polymerase sigma factor [Acidimicrobiia bacterium]